MTETSRVPDPQGDTTPWEGSSNRAIRGVEWLGKAVVAAALIVILVFTLGQIADRYILKGVFNAYDQIACIGLVWMTFIGMAMAIRERVNIVVDILDKYLSAKVVARKQVVLDILSAIVMALLVNYAWHLMQIGGYQSILGTPLTYSVIYSALFAGSIMMLFFLVLRVAGAFRSKKPAHQDATQ